MLADTLRIVPTVSKNARRLSIERESKKLKSALINNEDIKDLPRFRNRMTINSEGVNDMNSDNLLPDGTQNTHKEAIDESDSSPVHNNGKTFVNGVKTEMDEDSKRMKDSTQTENDDTPDDIQFGDEFDDDFHEDSTSNTNPVQELNQEDAKKPEKRGRGRPRKITKPEEIAATPKIKRKRGRPQKGTETTSSIENMATDTPRRSARILRKETPSYRIEKDYDEKTSSKPIQPKRKSLRPNIYENKKPVSLAKTRPNETQKPMYINTERIITSQNRDKRLRINTLDVIKHLIENFNPVNSNSQILNEPLIHNEFKNHVLHHLGYLFDAHANINDISQEINEIQKKKTQLRNKIFELKKSHTDIGSELNKMRGNYQNERSKFKNFNKMTNKLQSLSSTVDGYKAGNRNSSEIPEQNNKSTGEAIDKDIFTLSKVINPNSGMFKKLILINKKLSKIENELS